MKIAILGAGNVGGTLSKAWAKHGHQVRFGVKNPTADKTQALIDEIGSNASASSVTEAAKDADVVVLATPWQATQQVIEECGNLTNKIVIDCTNPLSDDFSTLTIGLTTSGAEQVAEWAKGAKVYKAFNQTGWENMANPTVEGWKSVMFVCGDDENGKRTAIKLTEEVGFEAIDAGKLSSARLLEPYGLLWIKLAHAYGLGRDFAFALVRRN